MDQQNIKSVLITGANAGIGKEVARQMALRPGVERVYLACRNEVKARAAKQELEEKTGKIHLQDRSHGRFRREQRPGGRPWATMVRSMHW